MLKKNKNEWNCVRGAETESAWQSQVLYNDAGLKHVDDNDFVVKHC